RQGDRVGEREVGGDRLLAEGKGRADGEPGGQQQTLHGVPWTGREGLTLYARWRSRVSAVTRGGGGGAGGTRWGRIFPAPRRGRRGQGGGSRSAVGRGGGVSTLKGRP